MSKSTRFCRQFGRACARYKLVDGADSFLVPFDADYAQQSLVFGLVKRCDKTSSTPPAVPPIHAVHFFTTDEPVPATVAYLQAFCRTRKVPLSLEKVDQPRDRPELNRIYCEAAIAHGCRKVALPDSVDFLAATILTNMSLHGVFSPPPVSETVQLAPDQPPVTFIRPLCLLADAELARFGADNKFVHAPTGTRVVDDPFMEIARSALDCMVFDTNNVRLNIFNAQFHVQKKYVGASDEAGEAE
jgi:hypothetical protein